MIRFRLNRLSFLWASTMDVSPKTPLSSSAIATIVITALPVGI
jgi:hypothetical protein